MFRNLKAYDYQQCTSPINFTLTQSIHFLWLISYEFHVPRTPMLTGFFFWHSDSLQKKVLYFAIINSSLPNTSVVVNSMEHCQNNEIECHKTYVKVTYDAIAKINLESSHDLIIFSYLNNY